jgi:hypothetical protein
MNKRISMMLQLRLHSNFSASLLISSLPYFLLISYTSESGNSCVLGEEKSSGDENNWQSW